MIETCRLFSTVSSWWYTRLLSIFVAGQCCCAESWGHQKGFFLTEVLIPSIDTDWQFDIGPMCMRALRISCHSVWKSSGPRQGCFCLPKYPEQESSPSHQFIPEAANRSKRLELIRSQWYVYTTPEKRPRIWRGWRNVCFIFTTGFMYFAVLWKHILPCYGLTLRYS